MELLEWAIENPYDVLTGAAGIATVSSGIAAYSLRKHREGSDEVAELYEEFEAGEISRDELMNTIGNL